MPTFQIRLRVLIAFVTFCALVMGIVALAERTNKVTHFCIGAQAIPIDGFEPGPTP